MYLIKYGDGFLEKVFAKHFHDASAEPDGDKGVINRLGLQHVDDSARGDSGTLPLAVFANYGQYRLHKTILICAHSVGNHTL
jgi:hypothetical protein